MEQKTSVLNFEPSLKAFREDVLQGMRVRPRSLPCKYFYDERGSQLFDAICELDEYYLTRAELAIMRENAAEIAKQIGPAAMLVEYGSGSSIKTRLLLQQMAQPAAYVPVDISREHLQSVANELNEAFPRIEVLPVCADFTKPFELPRSQQALTHNVVYFPGSTIGNFQPAQARALLSRIAPLCGTGGGLIIGIDLKKDIATIEAAYDDMDGVTADFNLNLLERINRQLDGDFDLDQFEHSANYSVEHGRVEISVISQRQQVVTVADEPFHISAGESIRTEYSHKYTVEEFSLTARGVGLVLKQHWTDSDELFAVLHLVVA